MTTLTTAKSAAITRVDILPAVTTQSHAANLLQLPNGTLLCTWVGTDLKTVSDLYIFLSRLSPGSSSWSLPERISSDHDRPEQNPVLFNDPTTGTIWLFHTAQPSVNQDQAVVIARTSNDQGTTWSNPYELFPGKKGILVKQPLFNHPDGTWIFPTYYCRAQPGSQWDGNDDSSGVMYSRDRGKTWNERSVPNSRGAMHMCIASPSSDSYLALYRSRWADWIYKSTSRDGINWTSPTRSSLPNPNSGICMASLPSGDLVLVFNVSRAEGVNHSEVGKRSVIWGTPRKALSVGISKDGGRTWKYGILEDGDGFCETNDSNNRELSYPSIFVDTTASSQKAVHIAYTYHKKYIKYVHIDDVEAFVSRNSGITLLQGRL